MHRNDESLLTHKKHKLLRDTCNNRPNMPEEIEPSKTGDWSKLPGKGVAKRHGKAKHDKGISKYDIRRCARRGGVKRITEKCDEEALDALRGFLTNLIPDIAVYTEYAGRKTVTPMGTFVFLWLCFCLWG